MSFFSSFNATARFYSKLTTSCWVVWHSCLTDLSLVFWTIARLICTLESDFEGATWDFFRAWIWKNIGSNYPDFFSGQAPDFFSDLSYETQLFLRLPPWKNSGWILPYFFQGGKSTHLFKTKNRVQIKGARFNNRKWLINHNMTFS